MFKNKKINLQLVRHYEIETELASKLRNSEKKHRLQLYNYIYDELFKRVPDHPQVLRKKCPDETIKKNSRQLLFLEKFLNKNSKCLTFMEIGAGDCGFAIEAAKIFKQNYAIDVSKEIVERQCLPKNLKFILSDGITLDVPDGIIDIAYSNQLMEHLHPDDALEQLRNIFKALVEGGIYICITPNSTNGPHDVSRYFDRVASGLHLKEYSVRELNKLFKSVGFSKTRVFIGGNGIYFRITVLPIILLEKFLHMMPFVVRNLIGNALLIRALLGIRIVGIK